MASGAGSHPPTRISPRKFSEKIALLNKKEREANRKFEEIIKEVQATKQQQPAMAPLPSSSCIPPVQHQHQQQPVHLVHGHGGVLQTVMHQQQQQNLEQQTGAPVLAHDEELRLISQGATNYQAVHAESLEEIEKVYENLMASVGQCDDVESQENDIYQSGARTITPGQYNGVTDHLKSASSMYHHHHHQHQAKQQSEQASVVTSTGHIQFIPSISPEAAFYQQTENADRLISAPPPQQTDLSGNSHHNHHHHQHDGYDLGRDSIMIPQQQSHRQQRPQPVSKDDFSGHNHQMSMCVANVCPEQQPAYAMYENAQPTAVTGGGRARVVSFGSACRQKYPCATSDLLNQQDRAQSGHQQHHATTTSAYHTQYLKEPSGDRSRQKSCSDPQLHITPNYQHQPHQQQQQHVMVNPMCNSENRISAANTIQQQQSEMDCCDDLSASRSDNRQQQPLGAYKSQQAYAAGEQFMAVAAGDYDANPVCDTTNPRGQLPGIKICTAEDEQSLAAAANRLDAGSTARNGNLSNGNNSNSNNNASSSSPPSRDGSLPDISNLKFCTNSSSASPEREVVIQKQQQAARWPSPDNAAAAPSIPGTTTSEFCNAGGWSLYGGAETGLDNSLELERNHQQQRQCYIRSPTPPNAQVQDETTTATITTTATATAPEASATTTTAQSGQCWPPNDNVQQQQQQFARPLPAALDKVNSNLSHSDCGFATSSSSPFHQQQGSLMICTSSDFYNNIIRSRSHNNISSINQQNKRSHQHYPCNTLQQLEQHHTSQYCLQQSAAGELEHQHQQQQQQQHNHHHHHQPHYSHEQAHLNQQQQQQQPSGAIMMNVRRIAELKACGSSTSPLDSSSNLNSPQSEMNSPGGSSTTEQCEPSSVMFPPSNVVISQQQFVADSNGSVCGDAPNSLQYMTAGQYGGGAIPPDQRGQQEAFCNRDVRNQAHH